MSARFLLARRYLSAGVRATAFDFHTEGHKYPAARRSPSMKKEPSWWRLRQIRHRDAVILSVLSSACLLAGELVDSTEINITTVYRDFIAPYLDNPSRPDRGDWAHDPRLHDGLRRHLRPPRRTPLLLGAYRSGSVPDGTRPGGQLARFGRQTLADDPRDRARDREAVRRSGRGPTGGQRGSHGTREPPRNRKPHADGSLRPHAEEACETDLAPLAQVPAANEPFIQVVRVRASSRTGHAEPRRSTGSRHRRRNPPASPRRRSPRRRSSRSSQASGGPRTFPPRRRPLRRTSPPRF